jgi:hypothetical protein
MRLEYILCLFENRALSRVLEPNRIKVTLDRIKLHNEELLVCILQIIIIIIIMIMVMK